MVSVKEFENVTPLTTTGVFEVVIVPSGSDVPNDSIK